MGCMGPSDLSSVLWLMGWVTENGGITIEHLKIENRCIGVTVDCTPNDHEILN